MNMFYLMPTDNRKSFYGKAIIKEDGDMLTLQSYTTDVCSFNRKTNEFKRLWGGYSATTMRHINAFLEQCFPDSNMGGKKWWESL